MRQQDIKTPAYKESPCFQNQQLISKLTFPTSTGKQLFITAHAVPSISSRVFPEVWSEKYYDPLSSLGVFLLKSYCFPHGSPSSCSGWGDQTQLLKLSLILEPVDSTNDITGTQTSTYLQIIICYS